MTVVVVARSTAISLVVGRHQDFHCHRPVTPDGQKSAPDLSLVHYRGVRGDHDCLLADFAARLQTDLVLLDPGPGAHQHGHLHLGRGSPRGRLYLQFLDHHL